MESDFIESLGPLLYALMKSWVTYKKSYSEAIVAYKNLTGTEAASETEVISKIVSSTMKIFTPHVDEFTKDDISAEEFLKKYQQIGTLLSMSKKLLG